MICFSLALKAVETENKDLKLKEQQHMENARALKFDNLTKLKTEKDDLTKQVTFLFQVRGIMSFI